jgi:hypothetical protein
MHWVLAEKLIREGNLPFNQEGQTMKKVIEGKVYNTETAEKIHSWDNGYYGSDFKMCEETLYRTKKGAFFLHGEGGPMSKYAVSHDNSSSYGSDIQVLSDAEVIEWLEDKNAIGAIEKLFPGHIEEG